MAKKKTQDTVLPRPPVVAVLGHVDHGKTTLLDAIRKSDVAGGEHGGITQKIGAYQVNLSDNRVITFIDTPGHEAFMKMRSRGAMVADVALLVVAADDSVMPQTKESISQIQKAKIPYIVVVNKIDLPSANIEKVKKDLAQSGVQVEGFGGDIPMVQVSAKQKNGLKELLDLIILVAGLNGITNEPEKPFTGVVIETRIDKGKGMVATAVVRQGTILPGMSLYANENLIAKVRAINDDGGVRLASGGPGKPVEILGFTRMPEVGSILTDRPLKLPPAAETPKTNIQPVSPVMPDFLSSKGPDEKQLKIVLKADSAGSLEAIRESLDPKIIIISEGFGNIAEADILLAKSCQALVIGFAVKVGQDIDKLAWTEKVIVKTYSIIYELLTELAEVVAGMKEVASDIDRELGRGKIIAEFPFDNQRIAGIKVLSGRIARGDRITVMKGEEIVAKTKIKSIRQGKNEINKAEISSECGILMDGKVDFTIGDDIIAFAT